MQPYFPLSDRFNQIVLLCSATIICPVGFEKVPGEDKCLFFSPGGVSKQFNEASDYCKSVTNSEGTLVEIRDQTTLDFIVAKTSGMFRGN